MSSSQSTSGPKQLCLWLHRFSSPSPPPPPPLPLPVSCGVPSSRPASRRLPLLVVPLLCSLLLMLLLLLWNYHCLFISNICSPPEEVQQEEGKEGGTIVTPWQ
ncbi:hypothetical protein ABVT39_011456 [Epinephelus coioides]